MYRTITRRWAILPAALVLAVAVTACEQVAAAEHVTALELEPQMSQSSAGESARGHADIGEGFERYSFTARRQRNGTVTGQFQVFTAVGTEGESRVHGEVTCMTVLSDGTARLGGRITTSDPALQEGQPTGTFWTVRDNGEGDGTQDEASTMILGAPQGAVEYHCATGIPFPTEPSARGNIQVTY